MAAANFRRGQFLGSGEQPINGLVIYDVYGTDMPAYYLSYLNRVTGARFICDTCKIPDEKILQYCKRNAPKCKDCTTNTETPNLRDCVTITESLSEVSKTATGTPVYVSVGVSDTSDITSSGAAKQKYP